MHAFKFNKLTLFEGLNQIIVPKESSLLAVTEDDGSIVMHLLEPERATMEFRRVHVLLEGMQLKHVWGLRFVGIILAIPEAPYIRYVFEEMVQEEEAK